MRHLKTRYPCRECGAPAKVETKRDAERAICEPCFARQQALARIHWTEQDAGARIRAGNSTEENRPRVALEQWLLGAAGHLKAASLTATALDALPRAERIQVFAGVRVRMLRATRVLSAVLETLTDAETQVQREAGFEKIEGGLNPDQLLLDVLPEKPPPSLRIVRDS